MGENSLNAKLSAIIANHFFAIIRVVGVKADAVHAGVKHEDRLYPFVWYNHLFYEVADNYFYDGENAEGEVQGNWDFDKKGRFNINLTGGQKVTMLKMWRKESLEALIEWVKEKKLFSGSLDVVPIE